MLHDDAVPAADALHRLLAHLVSDPSVDITGPKLLLPRRRRAAPQLAEIGVTISDTGRRELGLEPGEIDQGQRDQPQPRLAVSTCGMLLRAGALRRLGGFDPDLPVFRDGVELGWRAHLLGLRVVTTPSARVTHRQVGRAGLRPTGSGGTRPGRLDRRLGMLVVIGHAPPARLPLVWLRLVWSCLLHAAGYVVGKAPHRAADELAALGWFLRHPRRLWAFRRRVRAIRPVAGGAEVVRTLRPPWWSSLRVAAESVTGAVSARYHSVAGEVESATLDELTGDDFSSLGDEKQRSPWLSPVVLVTALLAVGSVVAARGLIGLGHLSGPALLPAPDGLRATWAAAAGAIPGAPGSTAPPWLPLMAVGSTVLAGQPEWLVTALLCAVVPAALLCVYPVLRHLVADRRVRLWAASNYALLPALLGGTNQGRLSLSVYAVLLPLLVLAVRALVLRRPRRPEAWRGGWGAGVVLVALVAFEPSMIVIAVLLATVAAVWLRRTPRKVGRVAIAVGLPLLVLAPWWPTVLASPGRLLVGPDAATTAVSDPPSAWGLLIGREVGAGLPPVWLGAVVFGVIWVGALLGLARRANGRVVLAAWVTAAVALATAVAVSRQVVSLPPGGAEARPWSGSYLLIAFAALILAAAVGVDGLTAEIRVRSFSAVQPLSVLAAVTVLATTVLGAAWWVLAGATGPIQRTQLDALPPYVRNAMTDSSRTRVLAVSLDGDRAAYTVLADDGHRLGDADRGYAFGASRVAPQRAEDLVLRMVAGTADSDIVPQLRELGIGYLWVSGASTEQQSRIDNTPGLGAASGNPTAIVWQLQPVTTRLTLTDGRQSTPVVGDPPVLPVGSGPRVLRTGEPADPRWRATVDETALTGTVEEWQQSFVVPAPGGPLRLELPTWQPWWLLAQGLVLVVAGVLAAPGIRRPEVRDPTRVARRAANLAGAA